MEEFTRDETTDGGGATAGSAPTGGSDATAGSESTGGGAAASSGRYRHRTIDEVLTVLF